MKNILEYMKHNKKYSVKLSIVTDNIEYYNMMSEVLSKLDKKHIIYSTNDRFESKIIEVRASYDEYLKMMKNIQELGYNLCSISKINNIDTITKIVG